jgi:hypothetical protein
MPLDALEQHAQKSMDARFLCLVCRLNYQCVSPVNTRRTYRNARCLSSRRRKTRGRRIWPKFFELTLQKVLFFDRRLWKLPRRWKPWKTNCIFSTVPTALGKLGKSAPRFPQFPQPLLLDIVMQRKEKRLPERFNQNRVDKRLVKA